MSRPAALALARLAHRDGMTQRAVLERLIEAADAAVVATLDPDGPEWDGCFGREAGTAASRGDAGPP